MELYHSALAWRSRTEIDNVIVFSKETSDMKLPFQ
ncbi:hypothetical protein PSE_0653 [Pseudovibrio sp. FO-BEG1]|nr:hypothetical protein PSE_0653 [Pseudovibrio sp. FO-BEG1]